MVESIANENATVMAMMEANCSPWPVANSSAPVAKIGNSDGMMLARPASSERMAMPRKMKMTNMSPTSPQFNSPISFAELRAAIAGRPVTEIS